MTWDLSVKRCVPVVFDRSGHAVRKTKNSASFWLCSGKTGNLEERLVIGWTISVHQVIAQPPIAEQNLLQLDIWIKGRIASSGRWRSNSPRTFSKFLTGFRENYLSVFAALTLSAVAVARIVMFVANRGWRCVMYGMIDERDDRLSYAVDLQNYLMLVSQNYYSPMAEEKELSHEN